MARDAFLIMVSLITAYAARLGGLILPYLAEIATVGTLVLLVKLPLLIAFGIYQVHWRYPDREALGKLAISMTLGSVLAAIGVVLLVSAGLIEMPPRSSLALEWILSLLLLYFIRMVRLNSPFLSKSE